MRHPSQFNLRALFILLFCFCVGLTSVAGTGSLGSNSWEVIQSIPWLTYESLLVTVATAMIIGLGQQIVLLRRPEVSPEINRSAVRVAIAWRIIVVILLALSIALKTGIAHSLIRLPVYTGLHSLFASRLLPEYLLLGCVIVVLIDTLQGVENSRRKRYTAISLLIWALAMTAILFVIAQGVLTIYYVYRALAGVELGQRPEFRRSGAYPNFRAEANWLFWAASAAVIAGAAGAACWLRTFRFEQRNRTWKTVTIVVGLLLLSVSAAFGYWFRFESFPTISPDFAEAGWASNHWDLIEAAGMLAFVVPIAAFRLSANWPAMAFVSPGKSREPVLHHSPLVAYAVGIAAVGYLVGLILSIFDAAFSLRPMAGFTLWQWFYMSVADVNVCVPLAFCLLSFQLLRKLWKSPDQEVRLLLVPIDLGRYCWALLAIPLIFAAIVPTIFAFCFTAWLVPWP